MPGEGKSGASFAAVVPIHRENRRYLVGPAERTVIEEITTETNLSPPVPICLA